MNNNPLQFIGLEEIPLGSVVQGTRLRAVDFSYAKKLAQDIERDGLTRPLQVLKHEDGYRLIHGAHRLHAVKLLGFDTVQAEVYEGAGSQANAAALLMVVDDSFLRRPFTLLEKSLALNAAKDAYEELYPQAMQGGDRKSKHYKKDGVPGFAVYAAERVGRQKRHVHNILALAANIHLEVCEALLPTPFADHEKVLTELGKLAHEAQKEAAHQLAQDTDSSPLTILARLQGITAPTPEAHALARLQAAWEAAPQNIRDAFVAIHWQAIEPCRERFLQAQEAAE